MPTSEVASHTATTRFGKVSDSGFEVLTAVVMKSIIFWDMTPCSPLNRRFGRTYRLHLQGQIGSAKNQQASKACHLLACWFFAEPISSTLKMEAICSSETSVETQRTTLSQILFISDLVSKVETRMTPWSTVAELNYGFLSANYISQRDQ
jgi:hypothetical protein